MRWRMIGFGANYRTQAGDDWDTFMSARPEIQRAMAARFEVLVAGFRRASGHRHRIEIRGRYWKGTENGVVTVKLGGVHVTWVDRADLHPGTTTELSSGAQVDDREFTGAGWDYDIYITFSMPAISTWTVSGRPTHVRGWPPITGAPAAGFRG